MILADMTFLQGLLAWLLIIVCCFLMLVVLIQRGRGGGLAGAFGGSGGSGAFGTKTGDVFTWVTVALASVFVLLAIVGNHVFEAKSPIRAGTGAVGELAAPIGPVDGDSAPATTPPTNGEKPKVEIVPANKVPSPSQPAAAKPADAAPITEPTSIADQAKQNPDDGGDEE